MFSLSQIVVENVLVAAGKKLTETSTMESQPFTLAPVSISIPAEFNSSYTVPLKVMLSPSQSSGVKLPVAGAKKVKSISTIESQPNWLPSTMVSVPVGLFIS